MERQGQYGHGTTGRVDEYGNPVAGQGTGTGGMGMGTHGTTGGMGMGTHGTGTGAGMGGQFQPTREEHKTGGILHRSDSSSSVTTCTPLVYIWIVFSLTLKSKIMEFDSFYLIT